MSKLNDMLDELTVQQCEELACTMLLDYAKVFYQNPANLKAFEKWKTSKEEKSNGTN